MIEIDIQQLQAELLRLLDEGKQSERIVVCKDGEPVANLRFTRRAWSRAKGPRPIGLAEGTGQILPGFYEPLPPDFFSDIDEKGTKEGKAP